MQEFIALSNLLHFRTGIGDRDEVSARFVPAQRLLCPLKKILLEDVWLECATGLTGNDEQRFGDVDLVFERFDLGWIRGVEHMQHRKTGNVAEGHPQNFGTETGATHAKQQDVFEAARLDFLGELLQLLLLCRLFLYDIEPTQPVGFVSACPQAGIAIPQALHLAARLPLADGRFHRCGERFGQGSLQSAHRSFLFALTLWTACSSLPPRATCRRHRRSA